MKRPFAWSADYPWIAFVFDFSKLPAEIWMALGECRSICAHIARIPLMPEDWTEMHHVYLAKGVQATTAIEGNTLNEDEVRKAIEGRLELPQSKAYLKQEVENILTVFNKIGQQIKTDQLPSISPDLLCQYNASVLKDLPLSEEVIPGTFRKHRVGVGSYRCPPAKYVPEMVGTLCERLAAFDDRLLDPTVRAILKAVMAHLYVAWIHPFADGNGRTARLLEAMVLMQGEVPSPAAHLLSNHYNATRTEYYRILDKTTKTRDPSVFLFYAVEGLRDELREQRDRLMDIVWQVVWKNHIYRTFGRKKQSQISRRHQTLALELAKHGKPLKLQDIRTLSADTALLYANRRSMATLRRDLQALVADKLVREERAGRQQTFVTNIGCLGALLPLQIRNRQTTPAET